MLNYAECERDLGVDMTRNFTFNVQCNRILSKASQQMGLTKRTCSFVNDVKRKRTLYLALVRSQFEHCSSIWRPTSKTGIDKFDSFQKGCIKWILGEENISYHSYDTYFNKCKEVDILPMARKFDLNDLIVLHKSFHGLIPVSFPDYFKLFDGQTRLRSSHLDNLSFVCKLEGERSSCLERSFFYRTDLLWNKLPYETREIESPSLFKKSLTNHLWNYVPGDSDINDLLYDFDSFDPG